MHNLIYFCVSVAVIWVFFVLLIVRAHKVNSVIGAEMDEQDRAKAAARFKVGD